MVCLLASYGYFFFFSGYFIYPVSVLHHPTLPIPLPHDSHSGREPKGQDGLEMAILGCSENELTGPNP